MYRNALFFLLLLLTCFPFIMPPVALVIGILFSILVGAPIAEELNHHSNKLLKLAVIGLGFSLNFKTILSTGSQAIWFTLIGITVTMLLGVIIGYYLKVNKNTSLLICAGTAICGGSAIAALAPCLHSTKHQSAVSLATVFILNSVALLLFPVFGGLLNMPEPAFGIWSALSIHDTSSVVGATLAYGPTATEIGITTKLARALWIMPLTFAVSALVNSKKRAPFPLFLLGFLLASAISTIYPIFQPTWNILALISKQLLTITLFLIGTSLTKELLKNIGINPLIQGLILWVFISAISLVAVLYHWVLGT